MRISDWSSDVCSSDLSCAVAGAATASTAVAADRPSALRKVDLVTDIPLKSAALPRASYVSGAAGPHCPADGQYRQGAQRPRDSLAPTPAGRRHHQYDNHGAGRHPGAGANRKRKEATERDVV